MKNVRLVLGLIFICSIITMYSVNATTYCITSSNPELNTKRCIRNAENNGDICVTYEGSTAPVCWKNASDESIE